MFEFKFNLVFSVPKTFRSTALKTEVFEPRHSKGKKIKNNKKKNATWETETISFII